MKEWNVGLSDEAFYPNIEAETKEEAIEMALNWWIERMPEVVLCREVEKDEMC